ncbi:MAG: hypothetical protein OXQ27_03975 [Chloroflexota bacterium]|nr:hypothetical protein [Chloroflexota bacterium]
MDLLFNDLSLHGQFHDRVVFQEAIGRLMTMRTIAWGFGRDIQCTRNAANALVTPVGTIQQTAQHLRRDQRSSLLQWLTRQGPFWVDLRWHGEDDYLECNGEAVTDTGLGEAAYRTFHDVECSAVSVEPSSWLTSPLVVQWWEAEQPRCVDVLNFWDPKTLKSALAAQPMQLASWADLEAAARTRYEGLSFTPSSFAPLQGQPFNRSAARSLFLRLAVLNKLKNCFNARGERTPEGRDIYQQHFTGDRSWFSDSSDTEKSKFKEALTFPHPDKEGEFLFCTWHGKAGMPQQPLRIHFSWPVSANESLYIAYVGPKLTRR